MNDVSNIFQFSNSRTSSENVKKIKSVTKMTNFVSNHYCSENLYKTFYVVKFIYSEKETKFCEIFTIDWHFKGQK